MGSGIIGRDIPEESGIQLLGVHIKRYQKARYKLHPYFFIRIGKKSCWTSNWEPILQKIRQDNEILEYKKYPK